MEAVGQAEHFLKNISNIFLLVARFVSLNKVSVLIHSASVDPEWDAEFVADFLGGAYVLHANRLPTKCVVGESHND